MTSKILTATFTRPADTIAYTALDAMSNATSAAAPITFGGRTGSTISDPIAGFQGRIIGATLILPGAVIASDFNLALFNGAPGGRNDNSVFDFTVADTAKLLGIINFSHTGDLALTTAGTIIQNNALTLPLRLSTADGLFGLLQTVTGFTPVASQVVNLSLFLSSF